MTTDVYYIIHLPPLYNTSIIFLIYHLIKKSNISILTGRFKITYIVTCEVRFYLIIIVNLYIHVWQYTKRNEKFKIYISDTALLVFTLRIHNDKVISERYRSLAGESMTISLHQIITLADKYVYLTSNDKPLKNAISYGCVRRACGPAHVCGDSG